MKVRLLRDIAHIQTGPFGSQLHKKDYVVGGIPIVTVEHLGSRRFTVQNLPSVNEADSERLSRYRMKAGDIIFSRVGSVDRCSLASAENDGWLYSGRCLRVRTKSDWSSDFLYYYLSSARMKKMIRSIAVGATMPSINTSLLGEVLIPQMPLKKQVAIASVLSAFDERIELNSRLNGYLEEACDAIYSSFAVDNNFDSGILADLVEVKYGKDHKKLGAGDIPVYGSGGFMRSVNDWLYQGESVLIPRKGSLNNVMFVNEAFWTVDTMFYTVPTCPGAAKYVYQFIKRVNLASMNSGSAVPSMTTDILNSIELPVPGVEQLTQFDSALEPYYSATRLNRTESSRLADLRDALLPKLMSGEIDVSKVDLTQLNSHLAQIRKLNADYRICDVFPEPTIRRLYLISNL